MQDEDTFLFCSSLKRHRLQAPIAAGMSLFLLGLLKSLCKKKKKKRKILAVLLDSGAGGLFPPDAFSECCLRVFANERSTVDHMENCPDAS